MRVAHLAAILAFGVVTPGCTSGERSSADSQAAVGAASPDEAAAAPEGRSVGPDSAAIPAGLAKAAFDVEGMTCGGCVLGTRMALAKVAGVRTADAAYDEKTKKGTAWAIYDPAQATPAQLMAAIRKLGYEPTPIGS
jgi:copper chaperone CopZ